jgi:hypothetical protein
MGTILPFHGRRGRGRRPAQDGVPPDDWRILRVVPIRPGWFEYIAAVDDVTVPDEPYVVAWREAIAAWGEVEWTWGNPLPGFSPAERYWDALVVLNTSLVPAGDHPPNVVDSCVLGPGETRPRWWGHMRPAQRARAALLAAYLQRSSTD